MILSIKNRESLRLAYINVMDMIKYFVISMFNEFKSIEEC